MQELSLHILDVCQNSISAGAKLVQIHVAADKQADTLVIEIADDGSGMDEQTVERVTDPFYTTRTTRKVGMGLSLLKMAARQTGGDLTVHSEPGKGTAVTATFGLGSIDRMPLGAMDETVATLVLLNPELDFLYSFAVNGKSFELDTREMRRVLEDIPLNDAGIIDFIRTDITQNQNEICGELQI